ncbi:MFS transporter [Sporosarcina highlanderae]|uniref:MFS transporter n=1 Tax=Sporosarcina highlanderae TaxID=3035916 RepID=A0ABT8JPY8_9BACL|nr:MFS transporter [Sporosarcina highlanderae]MDN4606254.1 MFS transporter [Sporosarcina highlanderae]
MQHNGYTIRDLQFWRIVLSLGFASIFIFASLYSMQPLLPIFTSEFDISVSYSSMAMSVTTIGLILGLLVLGFLSDRNGRNRYIYFSVIGSAIPFILIANTDSFLLILILRFVQGFALAGVPAAALAFISEEVDKQFTNVATALYISFNSLGGMFGRFMTGYIAEQATWQTSLYILSIFGVGLFILLLFTLPKSRNFMPSNATIAKDIEGITFHLKNRAFLLVFGLGIVLQLSFTGIWTYLPFHLLGLPYSFSLEEISYLYLAYGFGVLGAPLAGWLSGRFGLRNVRTVGIGLLSTGIGLAALSPLSFIVIGLCIVCLGFFTAHSLTAASVSKEATHHKGTAASLYLVSYYTGVAIGSTFLGPLYENLGWIGFAVVTATLPIFYLGIMRVSRFKKVSGIKTV